MKRLALFAVLFVVVAAFTTGCASHGDRLRPIRASYFAGDLETAKASIDKHLERPKQKEADVLKLDKAIIDLSSGRAKEAESALREVRDRFDHLEQKSAAEGIASMLSDDNAKSYAGEDYEKVLIRVFLSLANLMHDGGDAGAYAMQVAMKQDEIVRGAEKVRMPKDSGEGSDEDSVEEVNPKMAYKRVPFGVYLQGVLREETLMNYDDAARAYETVTQWYPEFEQAKNDLARAKSGVHSQPDHGVVYVFALVGRGPYKEQVNAEVTHAAMLVSTLIFNAVSSRGVTPNFAPILIPYVVQPRNAVAKIKVEAAEPAADENGAEEEVRSYKPYAACMSETITDVGSMAVEQCRAVETQTIARAVVRRAVKKGILYGLKEATDANPYSELLIDIAGIVWEGRETADTRCWGLLPETIQVARLELPAGEQTLTLTPCGRAGTPFHRGYSKTVQVRAARNTYVLANFPSAELVGDIVVSQR